jgi:hypothetical protein
MNNILEKISIRASLLIIVLLSLSLMTINYGQINAVASTTSNCNAPLPANANPTEYCLGQQVNVGPLPNSDSGTQDIGNSFITTALGILFGTLGAICFLIITIAGFRYILSRGEPQAIARSKDTIIYAIVGLVICIAAEAIIGFVVGNL